MKSIVRSRRRGLGKSVIIFPKMNLSLIRFLYTNLGAVTRMATRIDIRSLRFSGLAIVIVLVFPFGFVSEARAVEYLPTWSQILPASERFELLEVPCTPSRGLFCPVIPAVWGVLDKETGLVWEQSPRATTHTWLFARVECTSRTVGGRKGWRLPSVHELASLVDPTVPLPGPTLPSGHPFLNVQSGYSYPIYWSATMVVTAPTVGSVAVWDISFTAGKVSFSPENLASFVWCVRGHMNADAY